MTKDMKMEIKIDVLVSTTNGSDKATAAVCQMPINDVTEIVVGNTVFAFDADALLAAVNAARAVRDARR